MCRCLMRTISVTSSSSANMGTNARAAKWIWVSAARATIAPPNAQFFPSTSHASRRAKNSSVHGSSRFCAHTLRE
jgi:hypothetical protein